MHTHSQIMTYECQYLHTHTQTSCTNKVTSEKFTTTHKAAFVQFLHSCIITQLHHYSYMASIFYSNWVDIIYLHVQVWRFFHCENALSACYFMCKFTNLTFSTISLLVSTSCERKIIHIIPPHYFYYYCQLWLPAGTYLLVAIYLYFTCNLLAARFQELLNSVWLQLLTHKEELTNLINLI